METHTFKITIRGKIETAKRKAAAANFLANQLDLETLETLVRVIQTDPQTLALAKNFLRSK